MGPIIYMRTIQVIDAIIVLLSRSRAQVISSALPTVKEKSRAQGGHRECLHGGNDHRKGTRPIDARSRDEPDALAIANGKHPIAVMFNLVQPIGPRRRERREGREARP